MKKLVLAVAVLASSIVFGQELNFEIQSLSRYYVMFTGETGKQLSDKLQSINDITAKDITSIIDNPDAQQKGSSLSLAIIKIYNDSMVGYNAGNEKSTHYDNIHEFSLKDGVIRFQATGKYETKYKTFLPFTTYFYIITDEEESKANDNIFSINLYKYSNDWVGAEIIYRGNLVSFENYTNL